jgi:hypothetical protein
MLSNTPLQQDTVMTRSQAFAALAMSNRLFLQLDMIGNSQNVMGFLYETISAEAARDLSGNSLGFHGKTAEEFVDELRPVLIGLIEKRIQEKS